MFGEDENNHVTAEEETKKEATQDDMPDNEEKEVEFISVEDIMAEDDGLQYQLIGVLAIC